MLLTIASIQCSVVYEFIRIWRLPAARYVADGRIATPRARGGITHPPFDPESEDVGTSSSVAAWV
jgi:hypothetical protein